MSTLQNICVIIPKRGEIYMGMNINIFHFVQYSRLILDIRLELSDRNKSILVFCKRLEWISLFLATKNERVDIARRNAYGKGFRPMPISEPL